MRIGAPYFSARSFRRRPLLTWCDAVERSVLCEGSSLTTSPRPAETVKREWLRIVGHLFPDAVITHRSAQRIAPMDGELFLAHPHRDREIELPGLRVRARRGAGPLPDDTILPGGLHVASRARGLVENAEPTRGRGRSARRLTRHELGLWVEQLCRQYGEAMLNVLRDEARVLAPTLGVADESVAVLDSLIGVTLGTSDVPTSLAFSRYVDGASPMT